MSEMVYEILQLSDELEYDVEIVLPNFVCETYQQRPLAVKRRSFIFCKKIPFTWKWSVIELKVMLNTIWHSELKMIFGHFDSQKYHS